MKKDRDMICREAVKGLLDPDRPDAAAARRHATECGACRRVQRLVRALEQDGARARTRDLSAASIEAVRRQAQRLLADTAAAPAAHTAWPAWTRLALPAAACALVAVSAMLLTHGRKPPEQAAPAALAAAVPARSQPELEEDAIDWRIALLRRRIAERSTQLKREQPAIAHSRAPYRRRQQQIEQLMAIHAATIRHELANLPAEVEPDPHPPAGAGSSDETSGQGQGAMHDRNEEQIEHHARSALSDRADDGPDGRLTRTGILI